jgi:hypothetical protein
VITRIQPECVVSDRVFQEALAVIERAGAAELINGYADEAKGPGGRPPNGALCTITAVLVAVLVRITLTRPPSVRGILATIADFTPAQLAAVGMVGADPELLRKSYPRFHAWLTERLAPLDSEFDLPARRVLNEHDRHRRATRPVKVQAAREVALERGRVVMNRLVAGSILDPSPARCRGDVVVDGTIIDVCGPDNGVGFRDDKRCSASPMARSYAREKRTREVSLTPTSRAISKFGLGVEITVIIRIGEPDALLSVPPLITGLDAHDPRAARSKDWQTPCDSTS